MRKLVREFFRVFRVAWRGHCPQCHADNWARTGRVNRWGAREAFCYECGHTWCWDTGDRGLCYSSPLMSEWRNLRDYLLEESEKIGINWDPPNPVITKT